MKYAFLLFGAAFGFILSRAGATTFDFYAKLFLFQDLQLMWVIGSAVVVGLVGMQILSRLSFKAPLTGDPVEVKRRPPKKGFAVGAVLFGMGWGLAGACPGTALVMLGEMKFGPLFTIMGIVLGTYLYGLQQSRKAALPADSPPLSSPPATC